MRRPYLQRLAALLALGAVTSPLVPSLIPSFFGSGVPE